MGLNEKLAAEQQEEMLVANMRHALSLVEEAHRMIQNGLSRPDMGEVIRAAWRLADALGFLKEFADAKFPQESIVGLHLFTGRGRRIEVTSGS